MSTSDPEAAGSVHRSLGMHDAKIADLERHMLEVRESLRNIEAILSEAQGRWRVMVMLSACMAALGAGAVKVFELVQHMWKST